MKNHQLPLQIMLSTQTRARSENCPCFLHGMAIKPMPWDWVCRGMPHFCYLQIIVHTVSLITKKVIFLIKMCREPLWEILVCDAGRYEKRCRMFSLSFCICEVFLLGNSIQHNYGFVKGTWTCKTCWTCVAPLPCL